MWFRRPSDLVGGQLQVQIKQRSPPAMLTHFLSSIHRSMDGGIFGGYLRIRETQAGSGETCHIRRWRQLTKGSLWDLAAAIMGYEQGPGNAYR